MTEKIQRVAVDILTQFMFTKDMDEVMEVWNKIHKQYELHDDPFTSTPCTQKEYYKNLSEYEKQIMIERYGHCDGCQ